MRHAWELLDCLMVAVPMLISAACGLHECCIQQSFVLLNFCLDYTDQLILQIPHLVRPDATLPNKGDQHIVAACTLLALYGGNTSGGHMAISLYNSNAVLPYCAMTTWSAALETVCLEDAPCLGRCCYQRSY